MSSKLLSTGTYNNLVWLASYTSGIKYVLANFISQRFFALWVTLLHKKVGLFIDYTHHRFAPLFKIKCVRVGDIVPLCSVLSLIVFLYSLAAAIRRLAHQRIFVNHHWSWNLSNIKPGLWLAFYISLNRKLVVRKLDSRYA